MLFDTLYTLEYKRDIILENPILFLLLVKNTTILYLFDFCSPRLFQKLYEDWLKL